MVGPEHDQVGFQIDALGSILIGWYPNWPANSATTGASIWKLLIVIRSKNQWPGYGHVQVLHTYEEFKAMRNNFRVTVSDGSIVIKDLDTNKVFMKYKSDDIVKNDLKFMLVAGGWGGSGHFRTVVPKGKFDYSLKIQIFQNSKIPAELQIKF